jgi:putative NADH-flavin reductase
MKIAVIGATGNAGSRIVNEALRRGHRVTALSRGAPPAAREGLQARRADVLQPETVAPLLAGHDAVVSAVMFRQVGPEPLLRAVRLSGVRRYLVVGGAGTLEVAPGRLNLDQPDFPAFAKEEATAGKAFLAHLKTVQDLDWTFLSPSAVFKAGTRTGRFRLGTDALLMAADGSSWISYEDYALAMLDEIEQPQHVRRRFTVGY